MEIIAYRVCQNFTAPPFKHCRWSEIPTDLMGHTTEMRPKYSLIAADQNFWFLAALPHDCIFERSYRCGEFIEGLWNFDCAELFVCLDDAGAYIEFNLSPSGAWWACRFSDYRKRAEPHPAPPEGVMTFAELEHGYYHAAMAIPLKVLGLDSNYLPMARLNVNFILGSPHYRYFSACRLQSVQPDFHLIRQFPWAHFIECNSFKDI